MWCITLTNFELLSILCIFANSDLSYNKLKGPLPSFLQNPPILGYILKHNDIQCPLPSWCDRPPIGNGDCTPCVPAAVTNQSCCFAHLDPGCADKGIEQCVCLKEPLCCSATSSWNQNCVNLVTQTGCGNCLTGSCCIPHYGFGCTNRNTSSCVCDTQPLCCTKQWSSICVELAYNRCGDCLSQGTIDAAFIYPKLYLFGVSTNFSRQTIAFFLFATGRLN